MELVAEQPGDFVGEFTVKTELNVFSLSVSAKVLPAAAAAEQQQQAVAAAVLSGADDGSAGVAAAP